MNSIDVFKSQMMFTNPTTCSCKIRKLANFRLFKGSLLGFTVDVGWVWINYLTSAPPEIMGGTKLKWVASISLILAVISDGFSNHIFCLFVSLVFIS